MPATVLDSYALVAFFRDEPGAAQVEALLTKAAQADRPLHMTEVNYAEAKCVLLRQDGPAAWGAAAQALVGLPIEFHPAESELADLAADFKARFSLTLADAFAAALTKLLKAELVTGDLGFKALEKEMKLTWLAQS